jgi:hypothetical protein
MTKILAILMLAAMPCIAYDIPTAYDDAQAVISKKKCCHSLKLPTQAEYIADMSLIRPGTWQYAMILVRDYGIDVKLAMSPIRPGPQPRDYAREPKGK